MTTVSLIGQVLRHVESNNLGFFIQKFDRDDTSGTVRVCCKYFDFTKPEFISDEDTFVIETNRFMAEFLFNTNVNDYENPKWELIKDVVERSEGK